LLSIKVFVSNQSVLYSLATGDWVMLKPARGGIVVTDSFLSTELFANVNSMIAHKRGESIFLWLYYRERPTAEFLDVDCISIPFNSAIAIDAGEDNGIKVAAAVHFSPWGE